MTQFMTNNSKTNKHMVIERPQVNQHAFFNALSDLAIGLYTLWPF